MTFTNRARAWVWAAVPVGVLMAGCDAGQGTQGTGDTPVATAELVGSVQLSATHDVKFWDYGNGLARIEENLHADLDRGATLSMNKIDIEGRTLSHVYELFAGAQADPKVLERLHAIDVRLAVARSTSTSSPPESLVVGGQAAASGLARPPSATSQQAPSTPDGIAVRQSALACAEPAGFDWQADGQWFVANYCISTPAQPIYTCKWAAPALTEEWSDRVSYYRSSGFNQSFCSTASYLVAERILNGGVTFIQVTLINGTLPTRWVRHDAWTATGDAHFTTQIASTNGSSTVGLAINITRS